MNRRAKQSELVHDMRNRLSVIRANIEAFIDGKLNPTQQRLKAVLQSVRQLDELMGEIKSSAEAPVPEVRLREIDVCEVLRREYHAVEALAAEKGIEFLVFRCPVKLASCKAFLGDPIRIGQIVSNVLLNAVRFTPPGGTIRVDCTHQADQLQMTITDNGPGIKPGERRKIFRRGVRGSASRGKAGSGFGLAIAKEYVEAQGGTISADSAGASSGGGARFTVRLPGTVRALDGGGEHCRLCLETTQAR